MSSSRAAGRSRGLSARPGESRQSRKAGTSGVEQQEAKPGAPHNWPHCVDSSSAFSVALKRFASGSRRLRTRACVRRGPDTGQTPGTRVLLPATRLNNFGDRYERGTDESEQSLRHRCCSRARLGSRFRTGGRSWRQLLRRSGRASCRTRGDDGTQGQSEDVPDHHGSGEPVGVVVG